jgi:hypothetical protein
MSRCGENATSRLAAGGDRGLTVRPFKLGPLGDLNQVIVALVKTIRGMAAGYLDCQDGARICKGLGIMRACLETVTLERIEKVCANAGRGAQGIVWFCKVQLGAGLHGVQRARAQRR